MKQTNGSLDCADFHRSTIVSLSSADREGTLQRLQSALLVRMSSIAEHYDFFAEAQNVVEDLKKLGFDLWSWGYDGEAEEIWG